MTVLRTVGIAWTAISVGFIAGAWWATRSPERDVTRLDCHCSAAWDWWSGSAAHARDCPGWAPDDAIERGS